MNTFTIISLVSLAPAAFILYFILGHFEGYFKDNKAFFMIILGMGVGLVMGILSSLIMILNLLLILGVIFLIELTKMLIMLQKPFRLNFDTPFYGFGLGSGIGATFVFVNVYYTGLIELAPRTIIFILLLSINYTSINASTGAIIGYGSSKGNFWRYLFRAFIAHGILGLLMTFVYAGSSLTGIYSVLVIGVVYNIVLMVFVKNRILKKTIPEEMKKAKKQIDY
ncbi:MAG: hypothetical protein ACOCTK_00160 [Candidatus Saliniplasma sp.]